MSPTSRDVARLAGVSQPTVSRALRGDPRVAATTVAKVQHAVRELNYVPSNLGRSLRTRSTRQVGIVADLDNALYPVLMGPVHDELRRHGYRLVLLAEADDAEAVHEPLLDHSLDGVLLTTTRRDSGLPAELSRRKHPYVLLNRGSDLVEADTVSADNARGAQLVAELFLAAGHRRIGALLGPSDTTTAQQREQGFTAALARAGLALPPRLAPRGDFGHHRAARDFTGLMRRVPRPTAVFCTTDTMAVGAINAAAALGLRVPQDVSIVGFDDLDVAGWPVFGLTTVHNPVEDQARLAARMLVERIEGRAPAAARRHVAPVDLVLRGTHGPPPG